MKILRLPPAAATVMVQAIDMASQIAAGVLVARALGPVAMGHYTFALAVAGILAIVLLFGASEVSVTLYAGRKHDPGAILEGSFVALARGTALTVAIGLAIGLLLRLDAEGAAALALALIALIVNGASATFNYAILGRGASSRDLPVIAFSRLVMLAGVAWGAWRGDLLLAMGGQVAGAATLASGRALLVHRKLFPLRLRRDDEVRAQISRRGRWLILSSVFGTISARADMILLESMSTPVQLGLYGGSYRVINGIATGASAFAMALFPGLVSADPAARNRARKLGILASIALSTGPLLLVPFAGAFITLLYGKGWSDAGPTFAWLLGASVLQVQTAFLSRRIVAAGREKVMPFGQGLAATANIGVNLLLIPSMGARGAAIATFVAEVCVLSAYLIGPRVFHLFRSGRSGTGQVAPLASPAAPR
ncbi:MAG: oligosaccharide flippase family protein [Deltaproteobacteria bacterium]